MALQIDARKGCSRLRALLAGTALTAGIVTASPAFAQNQAAGDVSASAEGGARDNSTIIVTAQFREQNVQDTPLAITALSGDALETRGVESTSDLVAVAPGLNIAGNSPIFGASVGVFMRGVGQYDANFAYEPGVGIYLDDIYYGIITGADFALADIDRVEVLRGPQGTLSGKNSLGGSIKIYGVQPRGDNSGFIEAGIGSFDRIDVRGAYDFSLIEDEMAVRISAFSTNKDGFVRRLDFACVNPAQAGNIPRVASSDNCETGRDGGVENWGVRAALRYTPASNIEVNIIADKTVDQSGPAATELFYAFPPPVGNPLSYRFGGIPTGTPYDHRFVPTERYTNFATYRDEVSGTTLDPSASNKHWGLSADVEWELSDGLALRSITGYRNLDSTAAGDMDGSPLGITTTLVYNTYEQFTQELRLSGTSDILDWTIGGFYFDSTGVNKTTVDSGISLLTDDVVTNSSASAFAHVVLHPAENLNITGGIRYTDDRKTFDFTHYRLNGSIPTNPDGSLNCSALPGSGGEPLNCLPVLVNNDDRVDYRLGVDYRLSDEVMVYAQFSTGYKGGGFNPKPFTPGQVTTFEPESIDAYEAGIKTDLLDRRLRLNLAGFFNRYNDIQLINSAGFCVPPETPANSFCFQSAVPFNAGTADIKGFELEADFEPIDGLMFNGAVSYLDFQYKRLAPAAISSRIQFDDYPPLAPEWKVTGGIAYTFDMGDRGTWTPRVDVDYQSVTYAEAPNQGFYPPGLPSNPAIPGVNPFEIPGRTLVNARLTYQSPDELWQASLGVSNLFDKYRWTNVFAFYFSGYGARILAPPREWTLTVRRSF